MSYYMGDYYRGDPGFLSFLGGALKTVGGFIPGVGGLISGAGEAISRAGAPKVTSTIVKAAESRPAAAGALARVTAGAKTVIAKHPVLTGLGAAGAVTAGALGARRLLKGGGGMRKHRRMNPCNVRALRRAIRRAHGFERIARRVIRFTSPHGKKRFGGFKKSRKRKC